MQKQRQSNQAKSNDHLYNSLAIKLNQTSSFSSRDIDNNLVHIFELVYRNRTHQMASAKHKHVTPRLAGTRRLFKTLKTSPCHLTNNQSEECLQADLAPCNPHP